MEVVHPICCTQQIVLYETKTRFYLVGSNNAKTRFRILKIDRTEPTDLVLIDDKVEYNKKEIRDLLQRIDVGNRPKLSKAYEKASVGLQRRGSAYGIVGFVRFLEGYYMILISKRRRVALIGGHTIYKIDDTAMIPIANEQARSKLGNPDEARYLRIFQNVDLSSNFYYSYSYDLTHSLQYNLAPYFGLSSKYMNPDINSTPFGWSASQKDVNQISQSEQETEIQGDQSQSCKVSANSTVSSSSAHENCELPFTNSQAKLEQTQEKIMRMSSRNNPCLKFVWNLNMIQGYRDKVHSEWVRFIIHGFIGQSNICVYGKHVYVTLIARRSNKFAGTRFLKRGANDEGHAANEVETEQIVHDASLIFLSSGRYTSYTQLRGSAPFYWSQDTSQGRIVPKPQILVDRADPYCMTGALHFNNLMARFGAPVIILNLVKKKEKKPHEQILSDQLKNTVDYLNHFLPQEHAIQYIPWDMARMTKSKEINVIERLAEIAEKILKETGFFHSGPQLHCNAIRKHQRCAGMKGYGYNDDYAGLRQTGILRVNCVDCLDRTNTAQFMIGMCALGFQLHALGVTDSPELQLDSDAARVLEELYEAHGDTLALQYGGSQMVHRIRTYRDDSAWTSHTLDILQTVSRYCSNAFTDADKQQAINLFLGVFQPKEGETNLWDMPTDYYLHHSHTCDLTSSSFRASYTKWWREDVLNSLPFAREEEEKFELLCNIEALGQADDTDSLDIFAEYYRPFELTEFDYLYSHLMPTSCREFMPTSSVDPSPFVVRARGRGSDRSRGTKSVPPRKVIGGSPAAPEDIVSSEEDSSSEEDRPGIVSPVRSKKESSVVPLKASFQDLLPTMNREYGIELKNPSPHSLILYERYAELSKASRPTKGQKLPVANTKPWAPISKFSEDSTICVAVPVVSKENMEVYEAYVKRGIDGPCEPSGNDIEVYKAYIAKSYM